MIETKFSLELTKNGVQKTIYARQGENEARKLSITATCNGKVISLDDYTDIDILYDMIDPDTGMQCKAVADHTSNPIEFTIPGYACKTADERIFEVRFKVGTETLFSPEFRVIVEATIAGSTGETPSPEVDQYVIAKDGYDLVNTEEYTALKTSVADNTSDITDLKPQVTANTTDIADLKTDVTDLQDNKQNKSDMVGYVTTSELDDYATHVWVTSQGYATAEGTVTRQEYLNSVSNIYSAINDTSIQLGTTINNVAAAKQDTLTSANAGNHISIDTDSGVTTISATSVGKVDNVYVNNESVVSEREAKISLKTINSQSIVGEGNIVIEGGSGTETVEMAVSADELVKPVEELYADYTAGKRLTYLGNDLIGFKYDADSTMYMWSYHTVENTGDIITAICLNDRYAPEGETYASMIEGAINLSQVLTGKVTSEITSTSTDDVPNCTAVKEYVAEHSGGGGISYSTEEQDTGLTWIDGKKIYRKSYYSTSFTQSGAVSKCSIATDIVSLSNIISIDGSITNSDGNILPLNIQYVGDTGFIVSTWLNSSNIDIQVRNWVGASVYITIQYTKTEATE